MNKFWKHIHCFGLLKRGIFNSTLPFKTYDVSNG